jgi:hypothetical protein
MRMAKKTSELVQICRGAVSRNITSTKEAGKCDSSPVDDRARTSNEGRSHPENMATSEKKRRANEPARVAPSDEGDLDGCSELYTSPIKVVA